LKNPNHSLESLFKFLEKEGINAIVRQNEEGIIYGITYVDHRTKSVFNGSDLGKGYSAKGIQERCKPATPSQSNINLQLQPTKQLKAQKQGTGQEQQLTIQKATTSPSPKLLDELLQPSQSNDYLSHQLKKSRKRKRKRTSPNL
jgi:hypothetical protein